MDEPTRPPPRDLAALLENLKRAVTPEERQRAWDALVAFQREAEVRAQPRGAEDPSASI
jgi:hypothetical protein